MWCASRASAHSTTSPTLVRVRSLIRWWCTAPQSSSDGTGASAGSTEPAGSAAPRSDSTTIRAPPSIAAVTSAQISASRPRRAAPPPATRYRPSATCAAKPGRLPSSLM